MKLVALLIFFLIFGTAGAMAWMYFRPASSPQKVPQITNEPIAPPPDDGRFRWGAQVRPYALNRYTDELIQQQLDLARDLGVGWIRLDWHNFHDFAWHDRLIDEARKRGLHVVLILEEIGVPASDTQVIEKAKKAAGEIAAYYKGKVRYFQLLNEVSGAAIKGPSQPGTDFARDYDAVKYRQIRDWVKGAGEGIKAANPDAKLIVSGQWTHTAMFEQLIKDGVSFDIIGWNWFSDMGEDLNQPVVGETAIHKITLLEKLRGFGKELWVTELNYRPDPAGQDEPAQAAYLKKVAERIYNYDVFKGLFVFELLDQSEVKAKGGKPEYYGLVKFAKDSQGRWIIGAKKQAFDAYKQVIGKLSE